MEEKSDSLIESSTYYQSLFEQAKARYEQEKHFTVNVEGLQDYDSNIFVKALETARNRHEWQVTLVSSALVTLSVIRDESSGPGAFFCDIADTRLHVNTLAELLTAASSHLDFRSLHYLSSIPSGWDEDVWNKSKEIIGQIKTRLEAQEYKSFNNENTLRKLKELSNFDKLRTLIDETGFNLLREKYQPELHDLQDTLCHNISLLLGKQHYLKEGFQAEPAEELSRITEKRQQIVEQRSCIEQKKEKIGRLLSRKNIKVLLSEVGLDKDSVEKSTNLHNANTPDMLAVIKTYSKKIKAFESNLMERLKNELQKTIDLSPVELDTDMEPVDLEAIKVQARNESTSLSEDGIIDFNLAKERDRLSYLLAKKLWEIVSRYTDVTIYNAEIISKYVNHGLAGHQKRLDGILHDLDESQFILEEIARLDIQTHELKDLLEDINIYIKSI